MSAQYAPKGRAKAVARARAATAATAVGAEAAEAAGTAMTKEAQTAARLAQIVNQHIAGYSLSAIGEAIGASAEEVDRMLSADAARYVRSQPALRVYVRNYISNRYSKLLEAVWDEATDKNHREKLENQDRALRILDKMERLHGAAAPTQTEVTVEAAPDAVEKLVAALSAQQGYGYDTDIFDTVPGSVVADAVEQSGQALEVSGNSLGEDQPGDEPLLVGEDQPDDENWEN